MAHRLQFMLTARLYVDEKEPCFGPEVAGLMRIVQETQSLRQAAITLDMTYSRAWRLVHSAEQSLGIRLFETSKGGRPGGKSSLTPQAERILAAYDHCLAEVKAYSDEKFKSYFGFYQQAKLN